MSNLSRILSLKSITALYIFFVICLFFYSFTQVDLGLTLTKWSIWQVYQKFFQNIGYFQRQLSTGLYTFIFFGLSISFILFLIKAADKKITEKKLFIAIAITSVILLFSYNAFSHDLFNYIFDAKIFTYYHQNPYEHSALNYPGEPMLGFMHWTQRTYPYGPFWLFISIIFSFIGFNYFLFTLMLFKFVAFASFLGSAFFIWKILSRINPDKKLLGLTFFALNPLIIIESLVSAHNDIVMMFFSIFAAYLLVEKKYILAFLLLFLSIGIKFATVFLLPIFIFVLIQNIRKKQVNFDNIWLFCVIAMAIAVVFATIRTELQPWYFIYFLPFMAIFVKNKLFIVLGSSVSIGILFCYIPFLYQGNWDSNIPILKIFLVAISLLVGFLIYFFTPFFKNHHS